MDHTLQVLANLGVVVFVMKSMLNMGLSLTMLIILMGIGGEMGRRGQSKAAETTTAHPTPIEAS